MSKSQQKSSQISDGSFEDSLAKLQSIVTELEAGQLGLDDSLAQFETGIGLLRHCYGTLEAAEQKIEQLTGVDSEGNPITTEFDATATFSAEDSKVKTKKKSSPKKKKRKSSDTDKDNSSLF